MKFYFCDSNVIIGKVIGWDYLNKSSNIIFKKDNLVWYFFVYKETK